MSEEFRKMLEDIKSTLEDLRRRVESQEEEIKKLRRRVASIRPELSAPLPELPELARTPYRRRALGKTIERGVARPIPIRRLDRELYERVKRIAEVRGLPVGEVVNEALRFYLENCDLAYLEAEKMRVAERLTEIGMPGFIMDEEIREYLKGLYMERLEEIEERIRELRGHERRGEEAENRP